MIIFLIGYSLLNENGFFFLVASSLALIFFSAISRQRLLANSTILPHRNNTEFATVEFEYQIAGKAFYNIGGHVI